MPVVVAWIGRMLLSVAGEFLIKMLVGSAIGLATYGVEIYAVKPLINTYLRQAGPLTDYVGFLGIDIAITITLSAWAGRVAIDNSKAFFTKRAK